MQTHKAIILGPQCSGKTTIKKYLEQNHSLILLEEDDLFTQLNGGEYPKDIEYKENILRPKLNQIISTSENMIFITSYLDISLLKEFKSKGYKIIQLELDREEFNIRNEKRMKEQGCDDANVWADQIFNFHKRISDQGLVDKGIDTSKSVEELAKEIVDFLDSQLDTSS